jgi:hypothetical protein
MYFDRPSSVFYQVSLGMTKAEVLTKKGKPFKTVSSEGTEYLIYATYGTGTLNHETGGGPGRGRKYYIRFIQGKVESYGKVKDLDPKDQLLINQKD